MTFGTSDVKMGYGVGREIVFGKFDVRIGDGEEGRVRQCQLGSLMSKWGIGREVVFASDIWEI